MDQANKGRLYWLGCRPGKKDPRYTLSSQGVSEKCATGAAPEDEIPGSKGALKVTGKRNHIQLRTRTRIATWNVRSLAQVGKLRLLSEELIRRKIKICGLAEIWWKGKGHFITEGGHTVVYSGHEEIQRQGVGIWLRKDIANSLVSYEPISPRLVSVRIKAAPQDITLIQVYAPTADAEEDEHEQFYDQLQAAISKVPKKSILMVMGDFNAKVGESIKNMPTVGQYGLGDRNDKGQELVDFCEANNLSIMNTMFKQPNRRKYTWISPGGQYRNQIDYILIQNRWKSSVYNCKTFPGADCSSDHNVLVATFQFKFQNRKEKYPILKFDLKALQGTQGRQFSTRVSNKFQALNLLSHENPPHELWKAAKEILKQQERL